MSIIKSISVGEGDMFYIKHGSDNFTIIDCCLSEHNKVAIVDELKQECQYKGIVRFISTHPDDDHISGLEYLYAKMRIANFYCVLNKATKDESLSFIKYRELRDSANSFHIYKGCSRKWLNVEGDGRRSSGLNILWPIVSNISYKNALQVAKEGGSPNNISPIIQYKLKGGPTVLWMGDLETSFMESIKDELTLPKVNVLFAPHHGRDSGTVPSKWLREMRPDIIIIGEADSEHLNYYDGYNTITQNSAGDITLDCENGKVHIYVGNDNYSVPFLDDEKMNEFDNYIGTLNP